MGRHTDARLDGEDVAPSCTWGMLHLLNYHLWRSNGVKKVLHLGRRDRRKGNEKPKVPKQIDRRHVTSDAEVKDSDYEAALRNRIMKKNVNAASAKEIADETDEVEAQSAVWSELLAKLRHLLVPRPHKAHIDSNKAPVVENGSPFEDFSDLMPSNITELKRCLTRKEFEENFSDLGLFNAKNLLFKRIVHGADAVLPNWLFSGSRVSPEDVPLSKSASFPRFKMPSQLENKHNEVWPVSNGKILPSTPEENGNHQLDADSSRSNEIKIIKIRRSASLTESMDRHTQLLDYSLDKEMTRRLSRSLKVGKEKEYAFAKYAPKSLKNGLSLRDHLRSSNFLPSEASRGSFSADISMSSTLEDHKQNIVISESFSELIGSHEIAKSVEDASMLTGGEEATDALSGAETMLSSDQEESCIAKEDLLPTYMNELPIQRDDLQKVFDSTSFPISEGPNSEPSYAPNDSSDTVTMLCSNVIDDSAMRSPKTSLVGYEDNLDALDRLSHIKKDKTLDADDLHYVKLILELSGLLSKDQCQTRLLLEKPLDEALLEEAEAGLLPEPSCSSKGRDTCHHRKLLFDLIDEALLHIFDRSCTYYPKALSSMCQVRPVPTGIDVFKDVQVYICTYFSLRPVSDALLDGAVAPDLSKDKGWMSLQHDSESVALQLEHMIFNELLDEVIG
ncbi:hypothetical protein Droror1_Dr00003284 [Drosera rotundifolia]